MKMMMIMNDAQKQHLHYCTAYIYPRTSTKRKGRTSVYTLINDFFIDVALT